MQEIIRCKIDTNVFGRVYGIISHFGRSIRDIQTHINQYLKDASEDFERQLAAIELRLTEAEEEEKRAKEAKENARIAWDTAISARKDAETILEKAKENTDEVKKSFDSIKDDLDDAFKDKEQAKAIWLEAKEDQQEAFQDMKDHIIDHDDFVNYQEDTADKKDTFLQSKELFNEKKALFNEVKTDLNEAKAQESQARGNLKYANKQEAQAEKAFHIADTLYDKAVSIRIRREGNLTEAHKLVTDFKISKDRYYHPYYFEQNKSCDVILTQLRTDQIQEFVKAMEEIISAVNNILRCSLREGAGYEEISYEQPFYHKKTWEEDHRIREGLRDNKVQLNHELKRPVDEKPNYAERCKGCGRLISLCICPSNDEPLI